MSPQKPIRSAKPVRAVERAVAVLRCFSVAQPVLGVQDIARRTRLSRPTLYRILSTLEATELVQSSGRPLRYRLGPTVLALAEARGQ